MSNEEKKWSIHTCVSIANPQVLLMKRRAKGAIVRQRAIDLASRKFIVWDAMGTSVGRG